MMISAKRLLSNKKRVGGYPFWGEFRRYATDGRRIVKVGMGFSVEKRAMTEYIIEEWWTKKVKTCFIAVWMFAIGPIMDVSIIG